MLSNNYFVKQAIKCCLTNYYLRTKRYIVYLGYNNQFLKTIKIILMCLLSSRNGDRKRNNYIVLVKPS